QDLRPGGHTELDALAGSAVLARAAAVRAALRFQPPATLKRRQISKVRVGHGRDVAARPAVATVRPTLRDVLLPPEAERSVATAPGLDPDPRAIMEHDLLGWSDGDGAALAAGVEHDLAVLRGKDRVVAPDASS